MARLARRLEGIRGHIKEFRNYIRDVQNIGITEGLDRVKALNDTEDTRILLEVEMQWRGCREVVVEEDRKVEMDWQHKSRQLWVKEGDAITKLLPSHGKWQAEDESKPKG